MPKIISKSPEKTVPHTKAKAKNYKPVHQGGLCVLVRTSGTKIWQCHYQFMGKWKTLSRHPSESKAMG